MSTTLEQMRALMRKGPREGTLVERPKLADTPMDALPSMLKTPDDASPVIGVFDGAPMHAEHHLAYRKGKSDKVYIVRVLERGKGMPTHYTVEVMWGRRIGHKTKDLKSSHQTLIQALRHAADLVNEKIARSGYELKRTTAEGEVVP